MSWVVIALLGAAVSALVSIFDKTVIYRYAKTPLTLPLLIGFAQVTVGVVLLAIVRLPDALTLTPVLLALASGALYGLSGQFLMRVLFSNEVSRTIPVFQTYPIFTAIFAFLFFGEHIGLIGWLAILTVVAGGDADVVPTRKVIPRLPPGPILPAAHDRKRDTGQHPRPGQSRR